MILTTLNCVNLSSNFHVELTKYWAYQLLITKYLKQHDKGYNRFYRREMLSDHFNVKKN